MASGRENGLVCIAGGGTHSCSAIYGMRVVEHSQIVKPIGGVDVTGRLTELLSERGYEMTTSAERAIVRNIKEKLCFVSSDFEADLTKGETTGEFEHEYELPDGSKMTIGSERFMAPEVLFKPSHVGSELSGIHETIFDCIQQNDIDMRKELYQNIVLSGGSTMFEGIVERLTDEVQKLAPKNAKIKVNAPAERKFSAWIGGSILSSLSTFMNEWITKDEYDEWGAIVSDRKRC